VSQLAENPASGTPATATAAPGTVAPGTVAGAPAAALRRALGVATLVVAVQALLVTLFAWPALRTAPRDLPIVVAGQPQAVTAFAAKLGAARAGAFDISTAASEAEADAALRDHRAYAAFVIQPDGPVLHVASAAGPVVAQLLTQATQELGQGRPVRVVDVVPTDPDDPRGAGFAAGFLPLVLTSIMAGVLLTLLVSSRLARLLGVGAYAVLAGGVGTALLQGVLGALPGSYPANAAVVGLLALAMSATVLGLASVLGNPGLGLGALVMLAVGNPLSAVTAAPELLPQPWGRIGQLLPPGAGGTLLREVAYFDAAGGRGPALTLAAWTAVGVTLILVGRPRTRLGSAAG
jgi:hypothetical protein